MVCVVLHHNCDETCTTQMNTKPLTGEGYGSAPGNLSRCWQGCVISHTTTVPLKHVQKAFQQMREDGDCTSDASSDTDQSEASWTPPAHHEKAKAQPAAAFTQQTILCRAIRDSLEAIESKPRIAFRTEHAEARQQEPDFIPVSLDTLVKHHYRISLVALVKIYCICFRAQHRVPENLRNFQFDFSLIETEQGMYATLPDAILADPRSCEEFKDNISHDSYGFTHIAHPKLDERKLYHNLGLGAISQEIICFQTSPHTKRGQFVYCVPFPQVWTAAAMELAVRCHQKEDGQAMHAQEVERVREWPVMQLLELAFPNAVRAATASHNTSVVETTPDGTPTTLAAASNSTSVARTAEAAPATEPPPPKRARVLYTTSAAVNESTPSSSAASSSCRPVEELPNSQTSKSPAPVMPATPSTPDDDGVSVFSIHSAQHRFQIQAGSVPHPSRQTPIVPSRLPVPATTAPPCPTPCPSSNATSPVTQTSYSSFAACMSLLPTVRAEVYEWCRNYTQSSAGAAAACKRILQFAVDSSGVLSMPMTKQGSPSGITYSNPRMDAFIIVIMHNASFIRRVLDLLCDIPAGHKLNPEQLLTPVVYTCNNTTQCNANTQANHRDRLLLHRCSLLLQANNEHSASMLSLCLRQSDRSKLQRILHAAAICAAINVVPYDCDLLCEQLYLALNLLLALVRTGNAGCTKFLHTNDFDVQLCLAAFFMNT